MKSVHDFDQRLLACLQGLDLAEMKVRVWPSSPYGYRYFGEVISPSFEGMNEARRQSLIWGQILDSLDEDDQARVEFVATDTPAERSKSGAVPVNGQ